MRVQLVLEAIDRASRVIDGVHRAALALNNADTVAGMRAAQERAAQLQAQAQSNLVGAVATAASVTAPMGKAVSQFNSYEDILTDVGLKADITGDQLAQLGQRVRVQARSLNMSSVDMLQGLNRLAEGGLAIGAAEQTLPAVAKTALATKASIEDLSRTTVTAVNNMKVLPADMQRAFDIMSQAGKEGQFETNDMARYFPELGALYASMGQTGLKAVGDLAAALQVVRYQSGGAQQAFTGLRDVLTKIEKGTALKAFKDADIDIKSMMANARKSGTVIETVVEAINKVTGGDLSKINDIFGDVEAQRGARALVSEYQKFLDIRQKAMGATGTVETDFATRLGLGVERMRAISVAAEELGITLGSALAPSVGALADRLTGVIWAMQSWAAANPGLVSTIAMLATSVTGLLVGLAAFSFFGAALRVGLLALFGPLRWLFFSLSLFSSVSVIAGKVLIGLASAALPALLSPLALVGRAFIALGAAMMATPVGWIIAGIAAVAAGAYLIYRNWGQIGPWFSQLWSSIGQTLRNGWQSVVAWFGSLSWPSLPSFSAVLGNVFEPIVGALTTGWQTVTGWFSGLSWPSLPTLPDPLAGIRAVLEPVVTFLGEWGGRLLGAFEGAFGKVTAFIEGAAGRIGSVISGITGGLSKVGEFIFGPSAAGVQATAEQAAAARAAVEAIGPASQTAVQTATAAFAGVSFHSHGVAMMQTLATGIRAGSAAAVAAARATVQQIRDHLPHSPAKVGPLSDLHRVQFGQTLAGAIRAGAPAALGAVGALTAGMAGALPASIASPAFAGQDGPQTPASPAFASSAPAAGSGAAGAGGAAGGTGPISVSLTLSPSFSGSTDADFIQQLRAALPNIGHELAQAIQAEIAKRDRTKH